MAKAQIEIPQDPDARVALFNMEYPGGYEGDCEGSLEVASRYLAPRVAAVRNSLEYLEANFGPITWAGATFELRTTCGRGGRGTRCGANQMIVGYTQDGVEVRYRYVQGAYAEGGDRKFKFNGCAWTSISLLCIASADKLKATVKEIA
jgi:hypothetical protein